MWSLSGATRGNPRSVARCRLTHVDEAATERVSDAIGLESSTRCVTFRRVDASFRSKEEEQDDPVDIAQSD